MEQNKQKCSAMSSTTASWILKLKQIANPFQKPVARFVVASYLITQFKIA